MTRVAPIKYAPAAILLGATVLELQIPNVGVNLGNLFVVGASFLAVILALLFARRQGPVIPRLLPHDYAYLAYVAYVGLMAPLSVSPRETAVECVYLLTIWAGCLACASADRRATVRTIYWIAVASAALSFAMLAVSPSIALQPYSSSGLPELRGIFQHQLRLGLFMGTALGLVAVAALNDELKLLFRRPALAAPALGLLSLATMMAFARLYTVAAVAAFGACYFLVTRNTIRILMVSSVVAVITFLALNWQQLILEFHISAATLSLSGRTLVWARTLAFAGPGLVHGFGFGTFNDPSFDHLFPVWRPDHPHNAFIQAYFETGYIGLFLTLVVIGAHLRASLLYWQRFRKVPFSYYMVMLTFLGSFFGSNYAGKPTFLFTALLLMLGLEARITAAEVPATNA
jgi:O-antigen ligase